MHKGLPLFSSHCVAGNGWLPVSLIRVGELKSSLCAPVRCAFDLSRLTSRQVPLLCRAHCLLAVAPRYMCVECIACTSASVTDCYAGASCADATHLSCPDTRLSPLSCCSSLFRQASLAPVPLVRQALVTVRLSPDLVTSRSLLGPFQLWWWCISSSPHRSTHAGTGVLQHSLQHVAERL